MNSNPHNNITPVSLRMPKKGERCAYTGLSRSELYKLTSGKDPLVATINLMASGAKRGTRLIVAASLVEYIVQHGKLSGKLPDCLKPYASVQAPPAEAENNTQLVVKPYQLPLPLDDHEPAVPIVFGDTPGEFSVAVFKDAVRSLADGGYPDIIARSMVLGGWCHDLSQDQFDELMAAV